MAKYLYTRVSTKGQNLSRQFEDIGKNDIPEENVFADMMSGKNFDRPEYQRMLETIKEGDVVYFHSIDRMGRNYDDIIEQWRYITKEIKADIIVLDMPLLDTTAKNNDLTGKLIADIVLQLLSYVAQKERESILTRQREGIEIARSEGKYIKKNIDEEQFRQFCKDVDNGLLTVKTAAEELGISRKGFYYRRRMLNI